MYEEMSRTCKLLKHDILPRIITLIFVQYIELTLSVTINIEPIKSSKFIFIYKLHVTLTLLFIKKIFSVRFLLLR